MIDWRPNVPKSDQVVDAIKERIASGRYPADTQLPSEHELVAEFGFARGTARKVLTKLREQGVAYSVRGLGTFVAKQQSEGASDRRSEG